MIRPLKPYNLELDLILVMFHGVIFSVFLFFNTKYFFDSLTIWLFKTELEGTAR